MPTIEQGEAFVVTRGFRLNSSPSVFAYALGVPETEPDDELHYDRSYEGLVFRAIAVCGCMIAAECVAVSYGMRYKSDDVGKKFSLNTTEVEVWPVTKEYANALEKP